MSSAGKTPSDRCAECGHTRYVHPPGDGCDVESHYYVDACLCTGFKDDDPEEEFYPRWEMTGPGSFTLPDEPVVGNQP